MEISLAAEKIGQIGNFPITNSLLLSWISTTLLILLTVGATLNLRTIPRGIQNVFESILELLLNLINGVLEDEKKTRQYFPLLATIFIFIITNNWLGLLPGVGSIGVNEIKHGEQILVPIFRGGNADLNTTLALAIIAVISVQVFGVAAIGTFKYAKKFINFNGPINFFVGVLELISEFSKMISFSFRLFGNIFAGEVLLMVIGFIAPFIAPIPFFLLELFVGMIQALVFMMLTLVFIKGAIQEAH